MWDIPHTIVLSQCLQRCAALTALSLLGMATVVGSASGQAPGPSFDCAKARTVTERLICAEPELAKADREMAAAYRQALASLRDAKDRETLGRDQVEWLKGRGEACFLDET